MKCTPPSNKGAEKVELKGTAYKQNVIACVITKCYMCRYSEIRAVRNEQLNVVFNMFYAPL